MVLAIKKYLQIDNLILLIKISNLKVSYDINQTNVNSSYGKPVPQYWNPENINQTNVNSSSLIITLLCSNICFVLSPVSNESKYTTLFGAILIIFTVSFMVSII